MSLTIILAITQLVITLAIAACALLVIRRTRLVLKRHNVGDPGNYIVVTDGESYRVRGPFDTFYTIRFHDRDEARQYADQLAARAQQRCQFDEQKWRAA